MYQYWNLEKKYILEFLKNNNPICIGDTINKRKPGRRRTFNIPYFV